MQINEAQSIIDLVRWMRTQQDSSDITHLCNVVCCDHDHRKFASQQLRESIIDACEVLSEASASKAATISGRRHQDLQIIFALDDQLWRLEATNLYTELLLISTI